MKVSYFHFFLSIVAVFSFFAANAQAVPGGWQVVQLSNNVFEDTSPRASEGKVVWITDDGNDTEIMFYNGTSTVQLTNNTYDEASPQISGSNIVWSGFDGQDWEIFYYNGSSTTQLTSNTYNDINPSISGNHIAWQAADTGLGSHIFYYDGATTVQASTAGADRWCTGPVIDGSNIVWHMREYDHGRYKRYIVLYEDGAKSVVTGPTYNLLRSLSLKGNFITWFESTRTSSKVYRYSIFDDSTKVLGSTRSLNSYPNTSERATVWQTANGKTKDIYWSFRSGKDPYTNLTRSRYENLYPCISDLRIVWICHSDTFNYIYLRDGGRNLRLSTVNSTSVRPPYIDGTTITWAQRDLSDFEVWVAFPQPIYVDDSAPGSNNGTSWYNAYTKLQDALGAASSGDEIRVAQGIYYPDEGIGQMEDYKDSTFTLVSGTSLKGAYAGYGASNPNARDPNLYETILSGDLMQNDAPITTITDVFYGVGRGDNARHIITSPNCDENTILDGFTITNGRAGMGYPGGGLIAGASNILNISDCKFEYNQSLAGGAIYQTYGQLIIENCTFKSNLTVTGGAIYHIYGDIQITDCDFIDNHALLVYEPSGLTQKGGAIYLYETTSSIHNSSFTDNYAAQYSGAVHYDASGDITTDTYECTFTGNQSDDWGGAIAYFATGTGNFANCSFINNSSGQGGGLVIYNCISPYITNCQFIANRSTGSGGALWNGHDCDPQIFGSLFVGNSAATSGGAILCTNYNNLQSGHPRFSNCTFVDNSAPLGSLVACEKDSPSSYGPSVVDFKNSIMWQNNSPLAYNDDGSTIRIEYSDVQGGYTGHGNFDADPCFVSEPDDGGDGFGDDPGTGEDESANDDYGNLRLSAGSACIDRGFNIWVHLDYADLDNDEYLAEPVPYDLDGFDRFTDDPAALDTGFARGLDTNEVIDLGCYERGVCGDDNHMYPGGDANYDCFVDLLDLAVFAGNWLTCTDPDCN
ncbi:MAG: hypothetical protein JW912_00450 [Sedimentisphaerales bacterium]|nr:hypothetical protein [Sedimentisphaerales bacterium]